jgi:hypothetical protein
MARFLLRRRGMTGTTETLRIGVISLVGEDVAGSGQICEQNRCGLHVGDIACGQVKSKGSPRNICQSVDFAGLAAARWTDALRFRPPFPP